MNEASLYVHIPFCETKCPYCDFNSFAVAGRDVDGYLDALAREMDARGVPPDPPTLFIGGGTPTVVDPLQIDRYLTDLMSRLRPNAGREFTVEANPGSLTAEKIDVLKRHGVNRVSLGAQSLFDEHLVTLGRVHRAADVEQAYGLLRDAGIDNVNLDFIYAVPKLTRAQWAETLSTALSWQPAHLSCYALIYEPGTEFFAWKRAGRLRATPERDELAMFRLTERRLRTAGLPRYEISNFAAPGRECRHNLRYWRNQSYVGVGAGAHSYMGGDRLGNARHLGRYAEMVAERGDAIVTRERLTHLEGAVEMIVLGLRMAEGVDLLEVGRRFGLDAGGLLGPRIAPLVGAGYLRSDGRLRLARRGWRVADEVSVALLSEPEALAQNRG